MFLLNSLAPISTVVYEAQPTSLFDSYELIANLLGILSFIWGISQWIYDIISGNKKPNSTQILIFFILLGILFFAAGRAMSCSGSEASSSYSSCYTEPTGGGTGGGGTGGGGGTTQPSTDQTTPTTTSNTGGIFENVRVGDYVDFGSYYGARSNRKDSISWRVLDVDRSAGRALLITEYGVDTHVFHSRAGSIPWKDSSLRYWLNHSFYDAAFTAEEQDYILYSEIETRNYSGGYYYTDDYVFCLSDEEVEMYFSSDSDREAMPTNHAVSNGCEVGKASGNCCWWLRTPGLNGYADCVHFFGFVMLGGNPVEYETRAVRPAIYVSI